MSKRTADDAGLGVVNQQVSYNTDFTSFFGQNNLSNYVNTDNPATGVKLWNENLDQVFYSMLNYYSEHPGRLMPHVIQYIRTMEPWIQEKFRFQFTEGNEAIWTEFLTNSRPMDMAARGTLANKIVVRKESRRLKLTFHTNGFLIDLFTYNSPEGRMMFENHMRQLVSSFMISIMFDVTAKLRTAVFAYDSPETRMPDIQMPTTIEEADRIIRLRHMELNKGELGIEKMAQRANAMFAAQGESLEGFIIGRNEMDLIQSDPGRMHTFIQGSTAVLNRNFNGKRLKQPVNIKFHIIPVLSETRNNEAESRLLQIVFQAGSVGTHVNACMSLDFGEWKTHLTDFEMASWQLNGMFRVQRSETFQHVFQMQACNHIPSGSNPSVMQTSYTYNGRQMSDKEYVDAEAAKPGQPNRGAIRDFIRNSGLVCEKTRTRVSDKTLRTYDVMTRYDSTVTSDNDTTATTKNSGTGNMFPVSLACEVGKIFAKSEHIVNGYKTTAARMFKGLRPDEINIFESGLRWMDKTSKLQVRYTGAELERIMTAAGAARTAAGVYNGLLDADIVERRSVNSATSQKIGIVKPNKWGCINVVNRSKLGGYGHIAGVFTIVDDIARDPAAASTGYDAETLQLLPRFAEIYKRVVRNAMVAMPNNILLDPRMCPLNQVSAEVSPFVRACIVFDYGMRNFTAPMHFYSNKTPVTDLNATVYQDKAVAAAADDIIPGTGSNAKLSSIHGMTLGEMRKKIADCGLNSGRITAVDLQILVNNFKSLIEGGHVSVDARGLKEELINIVATTTPLVTMVDVMKSKLKLDAANIATGLAHLNYDFMYQNINELIIIASVACYNADATNEVATAAIGKVFGVNQETPLPDLDGSVIILPLTSQHNQVCSSAADCEAVFTTTTNSINLGYVSLLTVITNKQLPSKDLNANRANTGLLFNRFKHIMFPSSIIVGQHTTPFTGKGVTINDSLPALPFVNPFFPLIPNSVHLAAELDKNRTDIFPRVVMDERTANPLNVTFANGYPYARTSGTYETVSYVRQYKWAMYNEDAYWAFQRQFHGTVPYHLAQLIFYPLGGNPFNTQLSSHPVSIPEERWIKLHKLDRIFMYGGKLFLMNEVSTPALVRQCYEDVDTVVSAKVLRPWEAQLTSAVAAVAKGPLGTLYHNQPFDSISTEKVKNKSQFTREMQFGAAYQFKRRVIVFPNAAGSDIVGGCGTEWFDTLVPRSPIMANASDLSLKELRKFNYDSDRIGNKSNIAVLVGMSSCIGEDSHDVSIDICGYPDRHNYIGVMHECPAFDNKQQETFQWDGAAFFAYIYDPHARKKSIADFPYTEYNLENLDDYARANSLCHPTTIRVKDKFAKDITLMGRHIRGYQGPGCRFIDTGHQRVGLVV